MMVGNEFLQYVVLVLGYYYLMCSECIVDDVQMWLEMMFGIMWDQWLDGWFWFGFDDDFWFVDDYLFILCYVVIQGFVMIVYFWVFVQVGLWFGEGYFVLMWFLCYLFELVWVWSYDFECLFWLQEVGVF